jgi:hypothetical protein
VTGDAASDQPPDLDYERFLWFFLPLPEPLGVPQNWIARELSDPRSLFEGSGSSGVSRSLLIHQVPRSVNVFLSDFADVYSAAFEAISRSRTPARAQGDEAPVDGVPDLEAGADSNTSVITVAEVAVSVSAEPLDEAVVDAALDTAIELVRHLQLAVATVLQRGVRLVSRATLPPLVPIFHGHLNPAPQPPTFLEAIEHFVEGCGPPGVFSLRPKTLTEDELTKLRHAVDQLARPSAFAAYADLRREAFVQRDLEGNGQSRAGHALLRAAEQRHPRDPRRVRDPALRRAAVGRPGTCLSWALSPGPVRTVPRSLAPFLYEPKPGSYRKRLRSHAEPSEPCLRRSRAEPSEP